MHLAGQRFRGFGSSYESASVSHPGRKNASSSRQQMIERNVTRQHRVECRTGGVEHSRQAPGQAKSGKGTAGGRVSTRREACGSCRSLPSSVIGSRFSRHAQPIHRREHRLHQAGLGASLLNRVHVCGMYHPTFSRIARPTRPTRADAVSSRNPWRSPGVHCGTVDCSHGHRKKVSGFVSRSPRAFQDGAGLTLGCLLALDGRLLPLRHGTHVELHRARDVGCCTSVGLRQEPLPSWFPELRCWSSRTPRRAVLPEQLDESDRLP